MAGQARGDQTMSATLTEFLREQAEKRKGKMAERQGVLDEWVEALNRLYDTVREWLREADPDGVLAVKTAEWKVTEEELGTYAAPRIDIHGLGRWVGFVPKARHTVGTATPPQASAPVRATGRVDITNELRRYILYRVPTDAGDEWVIDDLRSPARPFDRAAFEAALMSYLR